MPFSDKRKFFLLLPVLLFLSFQSSAQTNYRSAVDKHAASIGYYTDMDTLCAKLALPTYSDSLKVRSFFYWITENIAYDIEEYYSRAYKYPSPVPKDSLERKLFYQEDYAKYVLNRKRAMCSGYAELFKRLCDRANIPCRVVNGYARTASKQIGLPFDENHSWNAVKLKNKWYLLDVCWASGYCNNNTTVFTKQRKEYYYLTAPEQLILNHYPTDSTWTLLDRPVSKKEFLKQPHIYCYTSKVKANTLNMNGMLKAQVGDTIRVEVELMPGDIVAGRSGFIEQYNAEHDQVAPGKSMPQYSFKREGNKLVYIYPVWSGKIALLEFKYGYEQIMAYKLRAEYPPKKPQ